MKFPVKLPQAVTQALGKLMLKTKASKPEICVVTGILCGGASLVMVGVKTWKNKEKLQKDISEVKEIKASEAQPEDKKKALTVSRVKFGKDICKTYWIPTVLAAGSVGLIWGGRTMLRKELSAVTSAYALLLESYNEYRRRVVEDVGIEKDQEYMHGVKMVDSVDSETGEVKKKAMISGDGGHSRYARWFNEGEWDPISGTWLWRNGMWRDNSIVNQNCLRIIQDSANDQLKANGFLFLNQVYHMLGLPETREGQIVGWTLNGGDGYVDFGIFPTSDHPIEKILPVNRLFLEGVTAAALLDFNVEGPILAALDRTYGRNYADKLVKSSLA